MSVNLKWWENLVDRFVDSGKEISNNLPKLEELSKIFRDFNESVLTQNKRLLSENIFLRKRIEELRELNGTYRREIGRLGFMLKNKGEKCG